MLETLSTYYPVLFLLFFMFMLWKTALKILKLGQNQKKNDTAEIDKHLNINLGGVSEIEVVNVLKDVKIEYKGW